MSKYIFCDIDHTLHNYSDVLIKAVADVYGISLPKDPFVKYRLEDNEDITLSKNQIDEAVLVTNQREYIVGMRPYINALNVINNWKHYGNKVIYITARSKTSYEPMLEWLIQKGFIGKAQTNKAPGKSDLFCFESYTDNKNEVISSSAAKIEFAIRTLVTKSKIGIIIDDNQDVLKMASYTSDLLPATLLHPWNKEIVKEYDIPHGKNWITLSEKLSKVYGLNHDGTNRKSITNYL